MIGVQHHEKSGVYSKIKIQLHHVLGHRALEWSLGAIFWSGVIEKNYINEFDIILVVYNFVSVPLN